MKHILAGANLGALNAFSPGRSLLAFDFDGTLAPIVADREKARMRGETTRLFRDVCSLFSCAVISGRARSDVLSLIDGASAKYVVGNHGIESAEVRPELAEGVGDSFERLSRSLQDEPGVEIEHKIYSLAIHYRAATEKRKARAAILRAIRGLPLPMRVVPGKLVLNVAPNHGANKGDAFVELIEIEQAASALYVGDDVTDEDVFKLEPPGHFIGIHVGESTLSSAEYFVRDQREVDRLLAYLVALGEKHLR